MKRPAEYYTLWNQAVEAVEIYLARNPRELTEDQLQDLFETVAESMGFINGLGIATPPADFVVQALVSDFLPKQ
jgi:hypothetical protein